AALRFPWANRVRYSKDAQVLLGAGYEIRIWDLAAAPEKIEMRGHVGGVNSPAFSPDGKLLASAGKDHTARVWDTATGAPVKTLDGFKGEVETVAFSADGKILATGDYRHLRFWQVSNWQELPFPSHQLTEVWACAFSPDGRFFAAGGEGGIIFWKI